MTISATSWTTSASTDHTSAREARSETERAQDFAGILASAVHTPVHKPKPEPKKAHEGTSELDRPQEAEDEKRAGKRHRAHAAAAATDASPSKSVDPLTDEIVQSTDVLNPELQAKLARVMSRVRDETGHDVKVAETFRTQDRQNTLFAQGREMPGSVVTWTQNSKHTQGRAVDLVLDGGAANLDAYATLQRIAKEEGLRTLGPRDPGHLELPGSGANLATNANDVTPTIPAAPADATGPGQVPIARLAQLAQVAQVSVEKPAEVARVASVARVQALPASKDASVHAVVGIHTVQGAGDDTKETSQRFSGDSSDQSNGKGEQRGGYGTLAAAVAMRDAASNTIVGGVTAGHGVTSAERADAIAALQDAPARPLSQITMAVDAGNGTTDRVQVALRGSSLNATIDASDAQRAQTMHARSDELVRALSRDGIDVESLRVRGVASATVVASPSSSHTSNDSQTSSRSERHNPWQQQERRQSQEDRQQQQRDQRRGQK
jgi:hypothetical protein